MLATSINYEGLPPVAPEFDAAALRANILDSQRHGQPYREFTRRGPCRTGHWGGLCRATSPFCAASASPTGAAPAINIRNGSLGSGRIGQH